MNKTRFEACKAYFIKGYLSGAGTRDREAAEEAFRKHVQELVGEAMADEYLEAETEHMRNRESVTDKPRPGDTP